MQKLLQHQGEQPPALEQFRSDVPDTVSRLIGTMLAKQPSDRFQNPAELLDALIVVADGLGISHSAIVIPTYLLPSNRQQKLLLRHAPWVIPLLLLVASVIGYELFASGYREPAGFEQEPLIQPSASLETSIPFGSNGNEADADDLSSPRPSSKETIAPETNYVGKELVPLQAAPLPPIYVPAEANLPVENAPPFPITPGGSLPVLPEPQIHADE